jgi:uncharacterized membrane protein YidH (DUF202 family)
MLTSSPATALSSMASFLIVVSLGSVTYSSTRRLETPDPKFPHFSFTRFDTSHYIAIIIVIITLIINKPVINVIVTEVPASSTLS